MINRLVKAGACTAHDRAIHRAFHSSVCVLYFYQTAGNVVYFESILDID